LEPVTVPAAPRNVSEGIASDFTSGNFHFQGKSCLCYSLARFWGNSPHRFFVY
jgi:hypothetical protein